MSMLFISAVLGVVVTVISCAIWLILRRGKPEAPQLEARVVVPSTDGSVKRPTRAAAIKAHQASGGDTLTPQLRGELEECVDDDEVELEAGLSFEASRVQRAASYFSQDQHPSFYALALDGMRLDVEVRFWGANVAPTRHQAYAELHLSVPDGQDHQPLLEHICQWLGVELKFELPFASTIDDRGVITCELSGKYCGLTRWQGRTIELFSWELGESSIEPLWFGVDHEQGRGWFWVNAEPRVRLKVAHHLSIHLQGGQPFERRAQAHLPGFVDDPLIRKLSRLAVLAADELFIRGQRVALVQEGSKDDDEDGHGFSVLILDHVSDEHARELVSCEGTFGSLDLDEGGQILALSRFEVDDHDQDVTFFEVFDLSTGQLLWRLASDDGLIYRVCVSPAGDRVALAKHVGGEDDSLRALLVYDARTGAELERSWPQAIMELKRWLEVGIVCALQDDEDESLVRQGVWLPGAGRWQTARRDEVCLPHSYELLRLRDDGIELLNGDLWPYVQLKDLDEWFLFSILNLEALPWVGPHHLLWSANEDVVLNVRDGSARLLLSDDLVGHYIRAQGDGVLIVEELESERLFWATFSVSELSSGGGVLTGVAW